MRSGMACPSLHRSCCIAIRPRLSFSSRLILTTRYHATCLQIDSGGPADKAGLAIGDKILEVDGLTTQGGQVMEI
jgi:S1-C subfamily serine protease